MRKLGFYGDLLFHSTGDDFGETIRGFWGILPQFHTFQSSPNHQSCNFSSRLKIKSRA
ncbi:hypothetical protein HanXRQr2_Chr04g0143201 [Helianthus annuus]|uniref:Uncharacterized protein n=1 Tax=Helianthus annuus TaxID=4232 RepID=A0A9K3J411_HELAN|nr:hypothetical protein HanXRQr2_Chr04g0143201 [Helianthus annuus]KAJ0929578.1 hypothetical protein HanPSC8_Chr04g0139251 [Helianthus annuus]